MPFFSRDSPRIASSMIVDSRERLGTRYQSLSSDFSLVSFIKRSTTTTDNGKIIYNSNTSLHQQLSNVDYHIKYRFWTLSYEYYTCCLVPVVWAIWGLILNGHIALNECTNLQPLVCLLSTILFALNLIELNTIPAFMYAQNNKNWNQKLYILGIIIWFKKLLAMFNFCWLMVCIVQTPCGQLLDGKDDYFESFQDPYSHIQTVEGTDSTNTTMIRNEFSQPFIRWIRFYDFKMMAMAHAWCSIGLLTTSELLSIKLNDLKMYSLWRLGDLYSYFQEMQNK